MFVLLFTHLIVCYTFYVYYRAETLPSSDELRRKRHGRKRPHGGTRSVTEGARVTLDLY